MRCVFRPEGDLMLLKLLIGMGPLRISTFRPGLRRPKLKVYGRCMTLVSSRVVLINIIVMKQRIVFLYEFVHQRQ